MTEAPALTRNRPSLITRSEIAGLLDHAAGIDAVRDSLIAFSAGRVQQPPVVHMTFPDDNGDCHVKCGHVAGMKFFVIKIAAGFYGNIAKDLPSNNGMMVALSATTGHVVALLFDEGLLTDWRTAYAGALATQLCWPEGATRVGIIGTGTQAQLQLRALRMLMPDTEITVEVWGRSTEKARHLVASLSDLDLDIRPATSLADLCRNAQVIITTTPATTPLVRDEWIAPGTHITAVGADMPGKQEVESTLIGRAAILLADSAEQCIDHGEFAHAVATGDIAADRVREIGAALQAGSLPRQASDISIADLTGLGAEDAAICSVVLARLNNEIR